VTRITASRLSHALSLNVMRDDDTSGNTIALSYAAALAFLWLIVAIPHIL
jgi:hypothetical protein